MPSATMFQCTPGFFRAMGTRLVAGRDFDARDRAGVPEVAIVNETLVKNLLPGQGPLGRRFRSAIAGPWIQILGVVEAGKYETLTESPRMAVWRPLA